MANDGSPWRSENRLREMYWEKEMSLPEIADELGCHHETVRRWMEKHGIDRREQREVAGQHNYLKPAHYHINKYGHAGWQTNSWDKQYYVSVHRLLAVAKYGLEEVKGKIVHHKNGIPWDNREENIGLFDSMGEHTKHHHEEGDMKRGRDNYYRFR